jgi:RNA:NAD 2'-phosphotransferase (TPT1/KptA family)
MGSVRCSVSTATREIALKVGSRRGKPRLIQVDAARAHGDGVRFYEANATFWMAVVLVPKYLKLAE